MEDKERWPPTTNTDLFIAVVEENPAAFKFFIFHIKITDSEFPKPTANFSEHLSFAHSQKP